MAIPADSTAEYEPREVRGQVPALVPPLQVVEHAWQLVEPGQPRVHRLMREVFGGREAISRAPIGEPQIVPQARHNEVLSKLDSLRGENALLGVFGRIGLKTMVGMHPPPPQLLWRVFEIQRRRLLESLMHQQRRQMDSLITVELFASPELS